MEPQPPSGRPLRHHPVDLCGQPPQDSVVGPIAIKIMQQLRKPQRGSTAGLQTIRAAIRQFEQPPGEADEFPADPDMPALPPEQERWMHALRSVGDAAHPLLQLRQLAKLAERVDDSEQRYMAQGPGSTAVSTSFYTCWWLADTTIGVKKESLASIACDIARTLSAPPELISAWQQLAESYPGLYRITARSGTRVSLRELLTDEQQTVEVFEGLPGEVDNLWWTRLVPAIDGAPDHWVSLTTPYLFTAPDVAQQWTSYLVRQLADTSANKLAPAYRRLMKRGAHPFAWFDYIIAAYAGVRGPTHELAGLPDQFTASQLARTH